MDKEKLEKEMKERGVSKEKMCQELGISRSAFYRKCRGMSQFTLEEIQAIVKILHLESPVDIFFN
ncbi:hypothetical protein B5E84_17950 [Lachnoclostridium sp. An14]|uniref:helix-turn-helix domain-containing protein n=1 Tax=Lachnoclostridium sp. An14 TaxID=1965562 RepID=UPI000B378038|nr:helix-turn-helix domain-containing protein [Lachnoclostridium sp. An14]OUQ13135.1 hypothetical protein B5E84_17950 [Lachnoclostridium sp. An14]